MPTFCFETHRNNLLPHAEIIAMGSCNKELKAQYILIISDFFVLTKSYPQKDWVDYFAARFAHKSLTCYLHY